MNSIEGGQMKRNSFKPGDRFICRKTEHGGSFDFVILGPGSRPNYFKCRLEYKNPTYRHHGMESEYSRSHLKKFGVQQSTDSPLKADE